MRPIRRSDDAPRVEMMPLIDVIFLLLMFFIYAQVITVPAQVVHGKMITLPSAVIGQRQNVQAITVDGEGKLFLNRLPIALPALDEKLRQWAKADPQPVVYLAVTGQGQVDRAPIFVRLFERLSAAGIVNFSIVGQKHPNPATRP